MNTHKDDLRSLLREKRRAVNPNERQQAARLARDFFTSHSIFKTNQLISCYLPVASEFDAKPIIQAICQAGKQCYLPILSSDHANTLSFARYQPEDVLNLNKYGILEPTSAQELIDPRKLDVIITPLVGFDSEGHRLGMGGGYFDRTFAFLLEEKLTKPLLIGLAYSVQEIEEIAADSWDVPLRGVITEKGVRVF